MPNPFERPPQRQPEDEPVERQVTSRHTANHGNKLYDVYKLIDAAEQLREEVVPIETFENLKGNKYWHDKKGNWLGPKDIMALAEQHKHDWNVMLLANLDAADHTMSVRDADYNKYPLLVVGHDHVIDGMHRLTRAWIDKANEVKIKRFEQLPDDAETQEQS